MDSATPETADSFWGEIFDEDEDREHMPKLSMAAAIARELASDGEDLFESDGEANLADDGPGNPVSDDDDAYLEIEGLLAQEALKHRKVEVGELAVDPPDRKDEEDTCTMEGDEDGREEDAKSNSSSSSSSSSSPSTKALVVNDAAVDRLDPSGTDGQEKNASWEALCKALGKDEEDEGEDVDEEKDVDEENEEEEEKEEKEEEEEEKEVVAGSQELGAESPKQEEGDDEESDSSSSSSSSAKAPASEPAEAARISDGASLLDLLGGTAKNAEAPQNDMKVDDTLEKEDPQVRLAKLEDRMVGDLEKLPIGPKRIARVAQLHQWLLSKVESSTPVCGALLDKAEVTAISARLRAECCRARAVKAASKRALPEVHDRVVPVPSTPPEIGDLEDEVVSEFRHQETDATPDHRTRRPGVSSLRGGRQWETEHRISFRGARKIARVVNIQSHRDVEDLWFSTPGQHVECDWCERGFAQVLGKLQGAKGRPQFAQPEFVCHSCNEEFEHAEDNMED